MLGAVLGGGASSRSGRAKRVSVRLLDGMTAAEQWQYNHQQGTAAGQVEEGNMEGQQHVASENHGRRHRSRAQKSSGKGQPTRGQAAAVSPVCDEQQHEDGCDLRGLPDDFQEGGDWSDGDESSEPSLDVDGSKVSGTSDSYADED